MGRKSGISIRSYAAATVASATETAAATAAPKRLQPQPDDSAILMQIEESEQATLQTTLDARPANTKRKYEGYQKEFVEWCNQNSFRDGSTVTKGKLHLFLSEQVVGRESKKAKGKIVGSSTVCGYVNAVVDLYNQQVALRTNSNVHPRSAQVKQLIKNVQATSTKTRKSNYQDRGIGSLLDGYHSADQFRQICDAFLTVNDLRGRAAFLLSHFGLLRGENVRDLELADMFSQELDKEGFQTCTALVILIQHGKTNTFGKMQHVGFMRNKDVHLCPVGAVALYLFERFHVVLEPLPLFRSARDWYDIKFLRGRHPTEPISYDTHKKCYETVFNMLGLIFNKKTHINRQQGVRQLEGEDVDISQTRRHGRWGMDTLEAVYAAPLARGAIRALSGHPARSRLYYLERAIIEPPKELQLTIFPGLELCKHKILHENWERNLAAQGFIELLQYLRVVLLQDAVFLYDQLPPQIRCHQLFGESFQQYRSDALAAAQTAHHPVEMQLQVAMPLLTQQMQTQHAAVMDKLESRHRTLVKLAKESHDELTAFLRGEMTFRLVPAANPAVSTMSADSSNASTDQVESTHQQLPQPTTDVPQYTMSRGISTVRQLWTEWHYGLANQPAIEYLEKTFGTKWRSSAKESKFFSRRLQVIKYVQSLERAGLTIEASLDRADSERGRKSIDAFSKWLRTKPSD